MDGIARSKYPIGEVRTMTVQAQASDTIEAGIEEIEEFIATQELPMNRILLMAGEWWGLKQSIGRRSEGPWAMIARLTGL